MSPLQHFAFALDLDSNSITDRKVPTAQQDAKKASRGSHDGHAENFAGIGGAQFERDDFSFDAHRFRSETGLSWPDEEPQTAGLCPGRKMDRSE